ncbi:PilW family protein [Alkalilimnicola ehrlichii MLHE-1]|uniref:Prepilin-type cleavage/methylation-like protein n=1 Tax=Alkalilimnicola ehrlichii (strain ATCC BAA-1101 / DSM 17681 / MLHE-1) TaxID=187272 RepID=Q0AAC4_ALKEH|nr:prepilin-type N-terminal cleavage/methylation domain-containing protein [Alkalilimnicola ehrlichii]ABI56213.1 Prepilin-type cleavage/methylation-like protein [Alkalilimnicola ehrlichii MLHE-1]
MTNALNQRQRLQRGVTLVELMVSLLIGSIILLGVVSLFAASRQTQETQQHINRVAEDARFFTEFIARDIRMAGYAPDDCKADTGLEEKDTIEWDANDSELTLRYCDDDGGWDVVKAIYKFAGDRVRFSDDGGTLNPLVDGLRLEGIAFGVRQGSNLTYQSAPGDATDVRTIRLTFTLWGEETPGVDEDDRAIPWIEFTTAVRNHTFHPLGND